MHAVSRAGVRDAVRQIEVEIPAFAFAHHDPFAGQIKFDRRMSLHRKVQPNLPIFVAEIVVTVFPDD
jgi:hypothetical protein